MGRPLGHSGFPVSLYEPDLAMLERKIATSGDDDLSLFPDAANYLDVSKEFFEAAVSEHIDKTSRMNCSRSYLVKTFGDVAKEQFYIPWTQKQKKPSAIGETVAKADMTFITRSDYGEMAIPRILVEVKKEKGVGEPVGQCVKEYIEIILGFEVRDSGIQHSSLGA